MADTQHIKGLDQLYALLQQVPAKIERNVMRGALRKGMADEIKPAAQANIHSVSGQLAEGLKVGTRARGSTVSANLKAKGPHGFLGPWIEFGVKPHIIAAKKGGSLFLGYGVFAKVAQHPGFKGRGFMRNALDARAQAAVIAAAEYMKQRLATKEGLDTAHIMIAGDE